MKKLLLILLAFVLFSCEKEEIIVKEDKCDCYVLTYVRFNNGNFMHNGAKEYYSDDCTNDGDRIGGYSGQGVDVEYRVDCQ